MSLKEPNAITDAPLLNVLKQYIAEQGPLSVADYMQHCLTHPEHGYYTGRDPLGVTGDFTTAPEVSQMFGDMIGAFLVQSWNDMGCPNPFALVEIGPGRGTLMADILRMAARVSADFCKAANIHLVEVSPVLRGKQKQALEGFQDKIDWHDTVETIPDDMPVMFVGNEFFDALPIRQYIYQDSAWYERAVHCDDNRLQWTVFERPVVLQVPDGAEEGDIYETNLPAEQVMHHIAAQVKKQRGLGLFIDYSYVDDGFGDTFQAVAGHEYKDPLINPGGQDLTALVDFNALCRVAKDVGVSVTGPVTQSDFLHAMGIEAYAEKLRKVASAEQQEDILTGYRRLTSSSEMGILFKVMGISA